MRDEAGELVEEVLKLIFPVFGKIADKEKAERDKYKDIIFFPQDLLQIRLKDYQEFDKKMRNLSWIEIGSGDEAVCYKFTPTNSNIKPIVARFHHPQADTCLSYDLYDIHNICYFLDNQFRLMGKYKYPHITKPIVAFSDGYFYEYAEGSEGFSWEDIDENLYHSQVILEEWNEFVNCFLPAQVKMNHDICESFDARIAKNIILSGN